MPEFCGGSWACPEPGPVVDGVRWPLWVGGGATIATFSLLLELGVALAVALAVAEIAKSALFDGIAGPAVAAAVDVACEGSRTNGSLACPRVA